LTYSEYINRLKNNRNIYYNLFNNVNADMAVWKPAPDRWSVLEIACHIADIEVEDFRYDIDLILFHPEDPWPHFDEMDWVTSRKYNDQKYAETCERFLHERDKSILWLEELDTPDLERLHSGNEFKGERKKAGDILASWIAHDLFHIRQLTLIQYDVLCKSVSPYSTSYSGFYK
jgi:DinB superfamily